ncbi:MAG: polysaccharide export protein [Myxococcaceae bacterium]|nr:polysaccharide export protein [Myxococcaceae bacterium]
MSLKSRSAFAAFAAALLLAGCKHDLGVYTSVDEFKDPSPQDAEYVIRPGDLLHVRVFNQDQMSARPRVRADGKISLPFLNDVVAAGYTPVVLSAQLQTRLKDFINTPVVTISLEEQRTVQISVLGEVARPGVYVVDSSAGVLQALAQSGGFTTFARKDIFVMRSLKSGENPTRIYFTFEALSRAQGKAASFTLRAGDVVLVE